MNMYTVHAYIGLIVFLHWIPESNVFTHVLESILNEYVTSHLSFGLYAKHGLSISTAIPGPPSFPG